MASLVQPTPVLVLTPDGGHVHGHTEPFHAPGADPQTPTGAESDRLVTLRLQPNEAVAPPAPVVFDLPDFALEGETVRMRALDDLAGCAAILAALERLVADEAQAEVYGLFTRAEEVGLLGARLLAEAGTLPHETLVVSVEASAVIPGVAQGEGPVIRTGDASYTFDSDAEQVLAVAREKLSERDPGFKCQRALMSGGTCEATAFAVFGYSATGVAFPLGNYHNATTRISDPEGGVDAEYIRLRDYLGGIDLISEAAVSVARRTRRQGRPAGLRLAAVPAVGVPSSRLWVRPRPQAGLGPASAAGCYTGAWSLRSRCASWSLPG